MDGKLLEEQYVAHLSDFLSWQQGEHAEDYVVIPENIGRYLSIDETSVSQGELYTIITNKEAKGRSGSIVAIIKGTDNQTVSSILLKKIPHKTRRMVEEVTLDMAGSMQQIVTKTFTKATRVVDRFHVQKLAYDALQQIRIEHRWEVIDQENKEMQLAKQEGKKFVADRLENGDTHRQLLARSRYLLFKNKEKWTPSQIHRAELLFKYYPNIEKAYELAQKLGHIYHTVKDKGVAFTKLAQWYDKVEKAGFKSFSTIAQSIEQHYETILNFFERRSTNASAESFNAKIKAFRAQFRGVRNISFFLYRLCKIYG